MAMIDRIRLSATVTASGGASQAHYTSALPYGGLLQSIIFNNATVSGFSTAGHMTITNAFSGQVMLSVTTTGSTAGAGEAVQYHPRAKVQDASAALLGGTTGAGAVVGFPGHYAIGAGESIKVETSSGAAGTSAGKHFTIDFYVSH